MGLPQPAPPGADGLLQLNDASVVLLNQVLDYYVTVHTKHVLYTEAKVRALDAADDLAKRTSSQYIDCETDLTELEEEWRHAHRLQERADDALLEARAAAVAAQERTHMAIEEDIAPRLAGAVDVSKIGDVAALIALGGAGSDLCSNFSAVTAHLHAQARGLVDQAIWPLAVHMLVLDGIMAFQTHELAMHSLEGAAPMSMVAPTAALRDAAAAAADPTTPLGRSLAARAVDAWGHHVCPVPRDCGRAMLMSKASFGSWVAARPGDIVRGTPPADVVTACRDGASPVALTASDNAMSVNATPEERMARQLDRLERVAAKLADARGVGESPVCDNACASQFTYFPRSHASIFAEFHDVFVGTPQ